jgi:hypothetical protein
MQAKFFTTYACSSNSLFLSGNPEVLQQCQSFTFSELTFYVTFGTQKVSSAFLLWHASELHKTQNSYQIHNFLPAIATSKA